MTFEGIAVLNNTNTIRLETKREKANFHLPLVHSLGRGFDKRGNKFG
jgi:hypothetical protein